MPPHPAPTEPTLITATRHPAPARSLCCGCLCSYSLYISLLSTSSFFRLRIQTFLTPSSLQSISPSILASPLTQSHYLPRQRSNLNRYQQHAEDVHMRVLSFLASAVAALATVAYAQTNPFSYPVAGNTLQAGSTVNIKWNPTTQGTVTLVLRNGVATDLNPGTKIACKSTPTNSSYSDPPQPHAHAPPTTHRTRSSSTEPTLTPIQPTSPTTANSPTPSPNPQSKAATTPSR